MPPYGNTRWPFGRWTHGNHRRVQMCARTSASAARFRVRVWIVRSRGRAELPEHSAVEQAPPKAVSSALPSEPRASPTASADPAAPRLCPW